MNIHPDKIFQHKISDVDHQKIKQTALFTQQPNYNLSRELRRSADQYVNYLGTESLKVEEDDNFINFCDSNITSPMPESISQQSGPVFFTSVPSPIQRIQPQKLPLHERTNHEKNP